MINLRQEFEHEMRLKFKGVELLFETSAQKYIKWLESKIEEFKKTNIGRN